jgi:TolB-like protein/Tfp pilus assembly protein PilF
MEESWRHQPKAPEAPSNDEHRGRRLDSWKEIASYLSRSEKTVRRWEENEGLPVHRLLHEKRGSVYAYSRELEIWLKSRSWREIAPGEVPGGNSPRKSESGTATNDEDLHSVSTTSLPPEGASSADEPALSGDRSETSADANAPPPTAIAVAESRKPVQRAAWRWVLLGVGVVVLLGVGLYLARKSVRASAIRSLAVLPLDNLSGDPNQEYFADGMTDELITELARIPDLRVVSRASVMESKGSKKPLRQIASELDVDAVVEGAVVRSGDRVRITAQLIDVRSNRNLWAQSFEEQAADAIALQDRVAREIAAQARLTLEPPRRQARHIDPAAYDAYLRGLYFLHKRDVPKSMAYIQQAIAINPGYGAAYAVLSDVLEQQAWMAAGPTARLMRESLAAARQAVKLDPESGEAYTALGSLEMDYARDWSAAERDGQRGIELSPSYSMGEMSYASYLLAVHREEEAVTHARRALTLDPLSFLMNRHLGSVLYMARHYDEALYYLARAAEMEPGRQVYVQGWISRIYEKQGKQAEAVSADLLNLAYASHDEADLEPLRNAYQKGGWAAYQQARIAFQRRHLVGPCTGYEIGVSYLRLGNRDEAFSGLNQAIDQYCFWTNWLEIDPLLDDLRGDSRYRESLRRLKLAE